MDTRKDGLLRLLKELENSLPSLERELQLAEVKAAEILRTRREDIEYTHELIAQTKEALQKVSRGLPQIESIQAISSEKTKQRPSSKVSSSGGEPKFSEQLRVAAKPLLEQARQPLTKDEMIRALREGGLAVETPQEIDLMRKALTRGTSAIAILVKGRGFWLKDREISSV